MTTKPKRLSAEKSQQLTKLLTITKTATMSAIMAHGEIAKVIALVAKDIGIGEFMAERFPKFWDEIDPIREYYALKTEWFSKPVTLVTAYDIVEMLDFGQSLDEDFLTYLKCLTELHKRRRKYGLILERQPFPTMVQVSPRSLMEYGPEFPPEALASWLTWRKFFYDIDNRSAQETGYLFEPILAAAIGGESKSAREKVVRRSEDQSKGRQVDCWKILADGTPLAYELKLRVTIAASGQGRFAEELSFAEDCRQSGVKPILVVLDPTKNEKLTGLQSAYKKVGGHAYVGVAAWAHLEDEAGPTMAKFIEKYVRRPVGEVSSFEEIFDVERRKINLLDFSAKLEGDSLQITIGNHLRQVRRQEDLSLQDDGDEEE